MSFETTYTTEEQALLSSLPRIIGTAMSFAAGSGLGTISEMIASTKSYLKAKDFATNELIKGILPNMQSLQDVIADSKEVQGVISQQLKDHQVKSMEQLQALALEDAGKVKEILAAKAQSAEAEEYKKWILEIAGDVAKAAKEGGFLGFGGTRISADETKLYNSLAEALGLTPETLA